MAQYRNPREAHYRYNRTMDPAKEVFSGLALYRVDIIPLRDVDTKRVIKDYLKVETQFAYYGILYLEGIIRNIKPTDFNFAQVNLNLDFWYDMLHQRTLNSSLCTPAEYMLED